MRSPFGDTPQQSMTMTPSDVKKFSTYGQVASSSMSSPVDVSNISNIHKLTETLENSIKPTRYFTTEVKNNVGAQGDKGDKGDKGDTGAQGAQGDKGDKGDTGAQGDKGDKGDTGAQGDKGLQGDKGDKGKDGKTVKTLFFQNNTDILPLSTTILTVPFNGKVWDLNSVLISGDFSDCLLEMACLTEEGETLVQSTNIGSKKTSTLELSGFQNVPKTLSNLVLRGTSNSNNKISKVISVDFTMFQV